MTKIACVAIIPHIFDIYMFSYYERVIVSLSNNIDISAVNLIKTVKMLYFNYVIKPKFNARATSSSTLPILSVNKGRPYCALS